MATTLEAKLKITAETAQASAAAKQLGKDVAGIGTSAAPAVKVLDDFGRKNAETAQRLRQTTQQLRQVGPQITDIVTQLAAGQNPLQILIQQGGQLRDVFGGFGNAFRAVGQVLSPAVLLISGAAAALGTVVFQAFQGAQESDALRKSFALTGNAAGVTAGQVDALARSLADANKVSIGSSREVVSEVVASGQFAGGAIRSVAAAVLQLGKLNGQTAAENLKQFTSLADGVATGAAKLNRQYNFLSVEQFKLIKQLEAQGRTQEAVKLVTQGLAQTLESRATPSVYAFGRAWEATKNWLDQVLDRMKALARDDTTEKVLARASTRLAQLRLQLRADTPGRKLSATEQEAVDAAQLAVNSIERTLQAERVGAASLAQTLADTQKEIKDSEKAAQDSRTALTAAGIQNRLAQELAAIEERRSAVDADHAKGRIGEREFAARSSAIDIERLQAQRSALQETLASESAKLIEGGKSAEQKAQQARVVQLEAQLIAMGSQIQSAVDKEASRVSAALLTETQVQAQAYVDVWKRAADQVAQFAQAAAELQARRIADPAQRARAEADAATAAARSQQQETERQLESQIGSARKDPNQQGQADKLQRELDALRALAKVVIDEAGRAVQFRSLQASAAEARAKLQSDSQAVKLRVDGGQITEAEGERQILDLRREQLPDLEKIVALLKEKAVTAADKQVVADLENEIAAQRDFRLELEKTARSQAVGGLANAISDIATRAKTGKEALLDMVGSFAKAMLDVLSRRLADQLVNQFIDAAGKTGGGGGFFGAIGSFIAGLFHGGGIAGQGGGQSRAVSPLAFALAPRYHSGNTGDLMRRMGVRSNERAVIVEEDEEILTSKNPRHVKNFKGGGSVIVGDVIVNGASGDGTALGSAGRDLRNLIVGTAQEWALDQMRPGGIFSARR